MDEKLDSYEHTDKRANINAGVFHYWDTTLAWVLTNHQKSGEAFPVSGDSITINQCS